MIGCDEKVVFVNAAPPTDQSMATMVFSLDEGGTTAAQSSVEVITQVGPAQPPVTHIQGQRVRSQLVLLNTLNMF